MSATELTGPVLVVGRPRSGTRVVADLLRIGGYFMGADVTDPQRDSLSWYERFVVPMVTSRFFPDWLPNPALQRFAQERLEDTWSRYSGSGGVPRKWGWKYPETLFVLPVLQQLFPRLRVVHLIRDGRDVCLSRNGFFQITGPLADPPGWNPPPLGAAARADGREGRPFYREFCSAITFGDARATTWHGIELSDPLARLNNRYLIQMHAWVTAVEAAQRHGTAVSTDYCELRYEELCLQPAASLRALLAWLGTSTTLTMRTAAVEVVRRDRVTAWRRRSMSAAERRDFERAVAYGGNRLAALGYA